MLVLAVPWLRGYFDLPLPGLENLFVATGIGAIACGVLEIGWRIAGWVDRNTSIDLEVGPSQLQS